MMYKEISTVCDEDFPSQDIIKRWKGKLKCVCISLQDGPKKQTQIHVTLQDLYHTAVDNGVITEMDNWFSLNSVEFYKDKIKGLFHRCEKCMSIGGQDEIKGKPGKVK